MSSKVNNITIVGRECFEPIYTHLCECDVEKMRKMWRYSTHVFMHLFDPLTSIQPRSRWRTSGDSISGSRNRCSKGMV